MATGPAIAMALTLVLGAALLMIAVVTAIVEPQTVTVAGVTISERQEAETAMYLAAFGILAPMGVIFAPRIAGAVAAGPNAAALSLVSALLATSLLAAILVARLAAATSWADGHGTLIAVAALWALAATALLARATRPRPWRALLARAEFAPPTWALAGALLVAAVPGLSFLGSWSVVGALVAALAIGVVTVAAGRVNVPRLGRRQAVAADLAAVALVLLVVPDLVVITPEDAGLGENDRFVIAVIQYHADFLAGPANQVLGGGAMLVDTLSQYGPGPIYLISGWFQFEPVGYGSLSLLDGVLTALFFAAGYLVLRMSGVSRPLAAAALAIAVLVLVFNREYPVGALLQEGPLRFGLPMVLIAATVTGARARRHATLTAVIALIVLGLSSVWSFEAFALTGATFAAMACFSAWLLPAGESARFLVRRAAAAAAACVVAHLLFAAITLIAAGQLPEWGQYLTLLEDFLLGDIGAVTYDVSRWSPGLGVGAAYLAGAIGLVMLVRLRPVFAARERLPLLALAGLTAYGALSFGYFVNRSAEHVVPYVSFQALMCVAVWLSLARRHAAEMPRHAERGALVIALTTAGVLLAVAWSSIGPAFDRSALGHALPGGDSPGAAVDRLRHFPPIDPRSIRGEQLLDRYMPRSERVPIVTAPALTSEILLRSGRTNRLLIADAEGESFVPEPRLPVVREAVAGLRAGDRLLLDLPAVRALAEVRANPADDPLAALIPGAAIERLQVYALKLIDRRFRIRPIHRDPAGFVVAELARRPAQTATGP